MQPEKACYPLPVSFGQHLPSHNFWSIQFYSCVSRQCLVRVPCKTPCAPVWSMALHPLSEHGQPDFFQPIVFWPELHPLVSLQIVHLRQTVSIKIIVWVCTRM